jgi:hypothetical protein
MEVFFVKLSNLIINDFLINYDSSIIKGKLVLFTICDDLDGRKSKPQWNWLGPNCESLHFYERYHK